VLSAGGYVVFVLPKKMVEGGTTGIGIIVQHLTGLPIVGTTSLAITAVVFMIAARLLGKSFGARSIYAMVLCNVLIDVFMIAGLKSVSDDMLLNAFYGGAVVGLGLGMIYFSGASTGGADALGQVFWKLKKIPIGRTLIAIDILVLGPATIIFIPIEQIMYSLIFIYIEIKVIDMVLNGIQANQRVMVVTDEPDRIKSAILDNLNRGITMFKGAGGYSGVERYMLSTVVPKKSVPEVRRIVSAEDEKAFVVVQDVHSVYGEGFEPLPKKKIKKARKAKNTRKHRKIKKLENGARKSGKKAEKLKKRAEKMKKSLK
jgi:uncharacterized membrane-anchored protein YitT (DUF2179 family)